MYTGWVHSLLSHHLAECKFADGRVQRIKKHPNAPHLLVQRGGCERLGSSFDRSEHVAVHSCIYCYLRVTRSVTGGVDSATIGDILQHHIRGQEQAAPLPPVHK